MPSLIEIEKSFCTLLLDGVARKSFLENANLESMNQSGFDPDGVRLYAKLVNYAYHEVMPSVYPGCMQLIGDQWDNVVNDYLEKFPPKHYNLNQSARQFPQYLAEFGQRFVGKFPFIVELADYEWIELEVMEDPRTIIDNDYESLASAEQFTSYAPVVNPTLVVRSYNYSIPAIVDCLSDDEAVQFTEEKVVIAIFRHPQSKLCKFLQLAPLAAKIIALAGKTSMAPASYKDLLLLVIAESADANAAVLQFLELVETLQSLKLFLGSKKIA